MAMPADTASYSAPQRRSRAISLPAGGGILLAMGLGGAIWVGIFALLV